MPYEGGAPLDSKFVRIRWPLKNGVPVWHAKHEVVPSWPASSETKRALCAFIQQHTSVSDGFVLRRWREHITTNVMRAENVTREVLNARLAGGTLTFPRQYYISVHDVKRVRQRVTSVKWKRDASDECDEEISRENHARCLLSRSRLCTPRRQRRIRQLL